MAEKIAVIIACITFIITTFIATKDWLRQTARPSNIEKLYEKAKDIPDPPWTIAGYFDRLIRVSEEIAKEKEIQKYEPIVLWLTLNGLQINEDGSYEWIQKENPYIKIAREIEEKEKQRDEIVDQLRRSYYYAPAASILYADNCPFEFTPMRNIQQADKESLMRMRLDQLQYQCTNLQTQLMNAAQTNIIVNTMGRCAKETSNELLWKL